MIGSEALAADGSHDHAEYELDASPAEPTAFELDPSTAAPGLAQARDPAQSRETLLMDDLVARPIAAFPDLPAEHVTGAVRIGYAQFAHSRIREFIPLMVERRSRAQLSTDTYRQPTVGAALGASSVPARSDRI